MKITIEGEAKEIVELVAEVQARPNSNSKNFEGFTDYLADALQNSLQAIGDKAAKSQM